MTRTVHTSADTLLADATSREPMTTVDGLSAVPMERVVIDGERYVAKWLSPELDWIMRVTGDEVCRPVLMWESGLYETVSAWVDPLVVDVARERDGTCVLLMRDASADFLGEGATPITAVQQDAFLRDMAGLHAGMWGFTDGVGLCRLEQLYRGLSVQSMGREAAAGNNGPPAYVAPGWDQMRALQPELTEQVVALGNDPAPLVSALGETPGTFVHHDWKGGNLGVGADGRTILIDWAVPGAAAGCTDLAWYLAINCDRLPTTKEQTIADYRAGLEANGIDTAAWFDRQLELALTGAFAQLGWSKTEDPMELAWWVERVTPVARELTR